MIDEKKLIERVKQEPTDGMLTHEIIEAIKEQPKIGWILCSERLPDVEDLHEKSIEDCKSYMIQRRCGVIDVAHYIKVYSEPYFASHALKITDVIAWQLLPEPYKP